MVKPASNPNPTQLKLKIPTPPPTHTHTLITYSNPKSPLIFFFGLSRLSSPVTHSYSLTLVTANPQAHTSPFRLPASRSRLTVSSTNLKLHHASANLSWPPSVIFLFLVHFVSHCFFFICVCDFCVCVCVFYLEKENYKFEIFVFVFFILKGKI